MSDLAPTPGLPPAAAAPVGEPAPAPRSRLGRFLGAYAHPGASRSLALVALGLLLDVLALPPGPVPLLVLAADAPFLWLILRDDGRRWKRWAFLYGALHFGVAVRWLAEIHPVQVLGAALVLAPVYVLLGLWIRRLAARGVPFALAVASGVVFEEMLRTIWMGGMPWPARSMSFPVPAPLAALVPAAAFLGAYSLSFLAGLASALVARLPDLVARDAARRARALRAVPRTAGACLAVLVLLVVGASARAAWVEALRGTDSDGPARPTVLVAVQGNVPQELKHAGDRSSIRDLLDLHLRLTGQALRQVADEGGAPFAILWPETMIPWPFVSPELAARFPEAWDDEVGVMRRLRADVPEAQDLAWLVGAIYQYRRGEERHVGLWDYGSHDSLFHVVPRAAPTLAGPTPAPDVEDPPGRPPWERGRHDKTKLVPGGEYTPLGEVLPPLRWFRNLVSVIPELDPGEEDQVPFAVPLEPGRPEGRTLSLGTVICFEIGFPARCRAWRRAGAQVLLNAANYGWFGRTGFRDQIQTVARLRAAELGVTVVMAGNTGPTAFYDPLGRAFGTFTAADGTRHPVGSLPSTFREGFATAALDPDASAASTPYGRWGDLPWFALGLLLVLLAAVRGARRAPGIDSTPDEGSG